MSIIRVMLLENKPKITFKEIVNKFEELKRKIAPEREGSFNFCRKVIERAVKNLFKLHLLHYIKENFDF